LREKVAVTSQKSARMAKKRLREEISTLLSSLMTASIQKEREDGLAVFELVRRRHLKSF
jgi:hypothetical protein